MSDRDRFIPDEAKRSDVEQHLHCFCCGTVYRRGAFRCCTRPNGMRSDVWASLWCAPVKEGGCGKCPRHCECPTKADRLGAGPLREQCEHLLRSVGALR